jgi:hypothetical protein
MNKEEKQYLIEQANNPDIKDISEVSDGYHTFSSLYNQRLCLFAALVNAYKDKAWKSRLHHDGEPCFGGGWFIVGITTPTGDYTYHYELKDWNLFNCKVLDKAPVFDGHTDKDVTRVMTLKPCYTSHWIPVEEELPKEKQKVLVYMPADERCDHEYMCEALYNYAWHKWEDADEPIELEGITHWTEIMPPRKEE